jgi:hypothetical protein
MVGDVEDEQKMNRKALKCMMLTLPIHSHEKMITKNQKITLRKLKKMS